MTETYAATDSALIARTRDGDAEAFSSLWRRHEGAARRLAASYARDDADRDDLVSVAFERVFTAIRNGGGPDESFRSYLFVTLRRAAAEAAIRRDELPPQGLIDLAVEAGEAPLDGEERALITEAFDSLADRWQTVLWHTAVEGRAPRDLAPRLGISANAAAAMAYRAREKLRQAYLQAHLQHQPHPGCEDFVPKLGAYVRGALSARDHTPVEDHVERCEHCQALLGELQDVNSLLLRSVLPILAPTVLKAATVATATGALAAAGAIAAAGAGGAPAVGAAVGAATAGAAVTGAAATTAAAPVVAAAGASTAAGAAGAAAGAGAASGGSGAAGSGVAGWFTGAAGGGAQAGAIAGAVAAIAAVVVGVLAVSGSFSSKPTPKLATASNEQTTTTEGTTTTSPTIGSLPLIPLPPASTPSTLTGASTTSTATTRHATVTTPATSHTPVSVAPTSPTTTPTTTGPTNPPRGVLGLFGHYSDNHPGIAVLDFRVINTGTATVNGLTVGFGADVGDIVLSDSTGWACGAEGPTVSCIYSLALAPGDTTSILPVTAPAAAHISIGAGGTNADPTSVTFP